MKIKLCLITLTTLYFLLPLQGQPLNFLLSGSQEVTLNQATGSAGYASTELVGSNLNYTINYTGTTALTGAHFHGAATSGQNAGVQVGLTTGSSPMTGTVPLSTQQVSDYQAGLFYLNLHTAENGGGELRGQVVPQLSFTPNNVLSGSQETGGVASIGGGGALISYNMNTMELSWQIAYEGLASGVTGMHFHGPANLGSNASVTVNVGAISGLVSESSGSTILNTTQANELMSGQWYLNIHTNDFGSGELRGQIMNVTAVPEPSTYALIFGGICIAFVAYRRRQNLTK